MSQHLPSSGGCLLQTTGPSDKERERGGGEGERREGEGGRDRELGM